MAATYKIIIKSTAGNTVAVIDNFWELSYLKRRNQPGEFSFVIDDRSDKISLFEDNGLVEIWRKNDAYGLGWYCDFYGIFRGANRVTQKYTRYTAKGMGILDLLKDRIVAYPPNSVNRSYFSSKPVETILHTLVKYNATSDATIVDGRIRAGAISGLSISANSGRGSIVDLWECPEQNLLDTLYDLATQYKTAFTLTNVGGSSWRWDYVENTDVSATQIFSLDRGNVAEITYDYDRSGEKSVAICGGKGEKTLKDYEITTGNGYDVTLNNRECYVNGSSSDETLALTTEGDKELVAVDAKPVITFKLLQTFSSYYGKDYNLNYLVTGVYRGVSDKYVVSEITVSFDGAKESVEVKIEDL